tara:strand:- start:41 stop:532 length:492 start_codon:yes stop_codon:yes gene_type:complete
MAKKQKELLFHTEKMTEKITPETYEKMNEEFLEEGIPFRIEVPTQERIDKWKKESEGHYIDYDFEPVDLVAQMWEEHNKKEKEKNKMQALVYSNGNQECERAESLLISVNQDVRVYLLDEDFTQKQFNAEFGQDAEYPQISVGLNHRGNLKETLQYLKSKEVL